MKIRDLVVGRLETLAHPSEQLEYEQSLINKAGHAPTELVETFCDVYQPKDEAFNASFTSDELKDLAHMYGLVIEVSKVQFSTVTEMLKDPKWRRVVNVAKEITQRLKLKA